MLMIEFERGDTMKKFDTYMVNKIFTVPYLDSRLLMGVVILSA